MIIYESRPDVTVEATVLAFKANNKILPKGGKEALHSNTAIIKGRTTNFPKTGILTCKVSKTL